jgi:hypothetical protein
MSPTFERCRPSNETEAKKKFYQLLGCFVKTIFTDFKNVDVSKFE